MTIRAQRMTKSDILIVPVRIAVLSAIGLIQFMLVMFGCIYVCDHFQVAWPFVRHLRILAPGFGLLSLVYPIYILMAMEPVQLKKIASPILKCPACGTKTTLFRIPKNWRQFLHGGWTCAKCGREITAEGKQI